MKCDVLAAVAAGQVDFSLTSSHPSSVPLDPEVNVYSFNTCAMNFYGRPYDLLRVSDVTTPSDSPVVKVSELPAGLTSSLM